MKYLNDNLAQKRMKKAQKEFDILKNPTTHFNKLDLVNSFIKDKK